MTIKEQALKVLSDHSNPREIRAAALREITAEAVAALPPLPEPAVRQASTPTTRSSAAGHTTSYTPASKAEVARLLDFVPTRPNYPEWLRIISAVASELSPAEAEEVLAQWSPEEHPGEYAEKIRNPLEKITLGTLVHLAREGGYTPPTRTALKFSLASRPPAAAVAAVPVPDDGEPAVADETAFFYALDDTDDPAEGGGSDFDGEVPPPMDYFTSKRTGRKYPLLQGKPGLRLPAKNNTLSRFAHGLADLLRDQPLFGRSGFCVRFDPERRAMALIKDQTLRTFAEETLTTFYLKKQEKDKVVIVTLLPHTATADEARAVLASDRFLRGLRPLSRVLPCKLPVMRKDGRIELPSTGYDAETRTWIMSDPEAAYDSTPMPLAEAVEFFEDVLSEFPFAADAGRSKAVAIAAILSVFCTALLPADATKPAFLYVANIEGSGKTTLAKLAALVAQGGDSPVESAPADESEWQKSCSVSLFPEGASFCSTI